AAGAEPLSYQWQLNGVNLADRIGVSGAQTPTLTLFGVQWWQAGNYSFVASNLRGPVTSSPAVLTVNTTPIWTNPGDKTISRGAPLLFTASAFDVDTPPQTLTYSLVSGAPSGASLDPATGLFTWAGAQSSSTNRVALRVTDNGSPSLSATQTININVVAGFLTNTT